MRALLLICLFVFSALCANAQSVLRSLDVYGSEQVLTEDIRSNWGAEFEQLAEYLKNREWVKYESARKRLVDEAGKSGIYAFVDIAVIESWQPDYGIHVTVDLVDPVDEAVRLPFGHSPEGTPIDPSDLIKSWKEYDARGRAIRDSTGMPTASCRAFHCVWGYKHPDLEPYGDKFRTEVNPNIDALRTVLQSHEDPSNRRAAVYLSAHVRSQKLLVEILHESIDDPHHSVREAAMDVLHSIASKRPDMVRVDKLIPRLDGPATGERAAALRLLLDVSGPIANRETILRDGGAHLVKLIQLDQPVNSEPAFNLLLQITGREDLTRYDVPTWATLVSESQEHED